MGAARFSVPEYPGVYVSEISSGSHTIAAASTSTACFIGEAVKGRPFAPTLVTSFTEFERKFGGLVARPGDEQRDMPLAVQHFFLNGGVRAFIVRTIDPSEEDSGLAVVEVIEGLTIEAKGRGEWANELTVRITQNAARPDRVDIAISEGNGKSPLEVYTGLGFDPDQEKFYATIINRDSSTIAIEKPYWTRAATNPPTEIGAALGLEKRPGADPAEPPRADFPLAGGSDGDPTKALGVASVRAALASIARNDEISILAVPGVFDDAIMAEVIGTVDSRKDMILVMDGPGDQRNAMGDASYDQVQTYRDGISNKTSYAALYWPWLEVPDPYASAAGATRYAPPSGFVTGLYARTDNDRGVWKAPAGTGGGLAGAVGLAMNVSDAQQDLLNPVGINAIRQFPDSGIVCWGARTLAVDTNPEYLYVPIRRLAIFLRKSLYRGTQWAVFEPNDEPLWRSITFNVDAFMSIQFRAGAFQGASPKEAYFVICNSTNNYQATIDAGQVHIRVGFAPLKPAEFVIIEIQQITQDS